MRQPITFTVADTSNQWAALAEAATSVLVVSIFAIGDAVQLRRAGDASASATIPDGASVTLVNIDLAQLELNVPSGAEASIVASPH